MFYRTAFAILLGFGLLLSADLQANEPEILLVEFIKSGNKYTVRVRLQHKDSGWDHYADAWRIVTPDGKQLAERVLLHPHVEEQPFTRSLGDVVIPKDISVVYVEAHDSVHGWSRDRVAINFMQKRGIRYSIK